MASIDEETTGLVTQKQLRQMREDLINDLEGGEILIPTVTPTPANISGGTNHCPNSNLDYSTMARTVAGTTPATAGDLNQEAWRFYRQVKGAAIVLDSAHALKAVGHSLYAADEGVNGYVPIWDRVNGWLVMGGIDGSPEYDVAVQPISKVIAPGQRWFVLARLVALDAEPVPAGVQLAAGFWRKTATDEDWIRGDAFDLSHQTHGLAGATVTEYRVLAKTDSGVSILSNVLTIATSPDILSGQDYEKIFYNAGPGFIEFEIMRHRAGVYSRLFISRNTLDFQYNDTGAVGTVIPGWPAEPEDSPRAIAQSRTLLVGSFGGQWALNELSIRVPNSYNYSLTNSDGQFLRFYLTAPTGVNRHIGVDLIWLSTTFNEWSPDQLQAFGDGTYPIASVSPTSGNQGSGSGVFIPPNPGTGGGTCILVDMPTLVRRKRRRVFVPYKRTKLGTDVIIADRPYDILRKRGGQVSEYYALETANGILYHCNARHRLTTNLKRRSFIEAQQVEVGVTKLVSWVRGRNVLTTVTAKLLILEPADVGTYVLRDPTGSIPDGHGMFVAGYSDDMDRGLYGSNVKNNEDRFELP